MKNCVVYCELRIIIVCTMVNALHDEQWYPEDGSCGEGVLIAPDLDKSPKLSLNQNLYAGLSIVK